MKSNDMFNFPLLHTQENHLCRPTHQIWRYFAPVFCGHVLVARIPIRSETGRPSARWMPSETHGEWFCSATTEELRGSTFTSDGNHLRETPAYPLLGESTLALPLGAKIKRITGKPSIGILQKRSPWNTLMRILPVPAFKFWDPIICTPGEDEFDKDPSPDSSVVEADSWMQPIPRPLRFTTPYYLHVVNIAILLASAPLIFGNKQIGCWMPRLENGNVSWANQRSWRQRFQQALERCKVRNDSCLTWQETMQRDLSDNSTSDSVRQLSMKCMKLNTF